MNFNFNSSRHNLQVCIYLSIPIFVFRQSVIFYLLFFVFIKFARLKESLVLESVWGHLEGETACYEVSLSYQLEIGDCT